MNPPIEWQHRQQLLDMLRASWPAQTLITGAEIGVFESLADGPRTAEELGQQLSGLALSLQAIERLWEGQPAQARGQLEQARKLVAEITEPAYAMILSLRPAILDDLGLVLALRALAEHVLRDTPARFELRAPDLSRRMPPEIETALFRTFQEAR